MDQTTLANKRRKYDVSRHHAWAGLGFLTVLGFIRILFPAYSDLVQPILIILIIYVVISLVLTYRYRSGLLAKQEFLHHTDNIEGKKIDADVEKKRLKLEKKKVKAQAKAEKKERGKNL